jgi:hypothetical protein
MTTALMVLPKKNTPGEWVAYGSWVVSLDKSIQNLPHFDAHDYYFGALICESIRTPGDAMLIAAAPRLLAALEAAMPTLELIINSHHPLHKQAVTALLLARGGYHDPSSEGFRTVKELLDLIEAMELAEAMKPPSGDEPISDDQARAFCSTYREKRGNTPRVRQEAKRFVRSLLGVSSPFEIKTSQYSYAMAWASGSNHLPGIAQVAAKLSDPRPTGKYEEPAVR